MNAGRVRSQAATEPDPLGTPSGSYAQPSHDFTLQGIMDLKGSMGDVQAVIRALQSSVGQIDAKLSKADEKLDERVGKISSEVTQIKSTLNATKWVLIVLGVLAGSALTALGFVAKEVWDVSKPLVVERLKSTATGPLAPPAAPTAVGKP